MRQTLFALPFCGEEACERQSILIAVELDQLFDCIYLTARESPREIDEVREQALLARGGAHEDR